MTLATIPSRRYEVFLSDHSGKLLSSLPRWDRMEFSQRVNDPWNCTLDFHLPDDDDMAKIVRSLTRDHFIEVYRTDTLTGNRFLVYEGFHHTLSEQITNSGVVYFGAFSSGYTRLLERRVVFPKPGLEDSAKSGRAETLIKAYIKDSMIEPDGFTGTYYSGGTQVYVNIPASKRVMPGFITAADSGRGDVTEYTARFTNLESVVKALIENGNLYYGIERNGKLGQFVFDCRPMWGIDRRVGNTAGNEPTIFSIEHGNMLRPIFSEDRRYEKNVAIVGGAGEGLDRRISWVVNAEEAERTPWAWSEVFIDGRKEETFNGLATIGLAELAERGVTRSLTFGVIQTPQSRWLENWNTGDFVTAYHNGVRFDKVIKEIRVTVSSSLADDESITVEMDDIRSTDVYGRLLITT